MGKIFGRGKSVTPHQQAVASGRESLAEGYRQEAAETDSPAERSRLLGKAAGLEQQARDIRRGRSAGL